MRTVAVCQARMGSTRLPGKVLKPIQGYPTIGWVVNAAREAPGVDVVVVATSTLPGDDLIAKWCKVSDINCYRGSEIDVLDRIYQTAKLYNANIIVRLTCDCPFLDPQVIGEVIQLRKIKGADYATNTDPPTYPDGLDVEVFTMAALEICAKEATRGSDRDTVTRFMVRNRHRFSSANLHCPVSGLVRERWVLDSPEDYDFVKAVAGELKKTPANYLEILRVLDANPELRKINSKYSRNERFYDGITTEDLGTRSYATSHGLLAKAETIIPLGTQTFSKSKLMFPEGVSPLFVTHGDGGYVYDVDGNDYVDLVCGLLPNILGYRDPDVDQAIREQLDRGISFSLATPLEQELSELLCDLIPSAEMVKFGKNGSDVTTAAVRLARHITGREEIWTGGYHGWHHWCAPNTNGITFYELEDVNKCTVADLIDGSLDKFPPACVIIEPEFIAPENLVRIRKSCDEHHIILIFDEIITGFRCGLGGLQEKTGVIPDLSTFGKSMANGMPISALVGKREYMKHMPEIAYSGTFFGETLSIAAALATIRKLISHQVPQYLEIKGLYLKGQIELLLEKHKIDNISIFGPPQLNRIQFLDKSTQSLFIETMANNGVLIIGSHNTCFAHKKPELSRILSAWDKTLAVIASGAMPKGQIRGNSVRESQ